MITHDRTPAAIAIVVAGTLMLSAQMAGGHDESAGEQATPLERGKYLVNTAGCHDCHTPFQMGPNGPEPDMSRMLSGHPESLIMPPSPALPEGPWQIVVSGTATAHSGPWGVSFTANLTPDEETGLGEWTMQEFVDTIRTGRHLGRGRAILPPMPIPVYKNMTDADLQAIYTYLQSIPPISNKVPDPIVPDEPELEVPVLSE